MAARESLFRFQIVYRPAELLTQLSMYEIYVRLFPYIFVFRVMFPRVECRPRAVLNVTRNTSIRNTSKAGLQTLR